MPERLRKLPISKTVFREIIEEDCCYVDKTRFIELLANDHSKYWFLARPRRFGKSLFLDTLRAAFSGERELFTGLYLEKHWDWNSTFPVIELDLSACSAVDAESLDTALRELLHETATRNGVQLHTESPAAQLHELIREIAVDRDTRVVVLIDEYDKPLMDNLTAPAAGAVRDGLSSFYAALKTSDEHLRFTLLTGVSKFSKTSIFSKLNNLVDISLSPKYADICGYTQSDLTDVFKAHLRDVDLDELKAWYNGYNFLGSPLYNPFDVLLFLNEKRFSCYWFETGTPGFLLDILKEQRYYLPDLDQAQVSEAMLGEFELDHITLEALLFQTGYLTIREELTGGPLTNYRLCLPNREVRIGFNEYLLRMFYAPGSRAQQQNALTNQVYQALLNRDPAQLEPAFHTFFAGVPHDWYRRNHISEYEGYYCSMFYAVFAALGLDIRAEDATSRGRIDFTLNLDNAVYVFEIKMAANPGKALDQIRERGYHHKYETSGKHIFLVGIEFDEAERNISNFAWERKK